MVRQIKFYCYNAIEITFCCLLYITGNVITTTAGISEKANNDAGDGAVIIRESSPKSSSLSSSNSHGSSSGSSGATANQPHRDSLQNNDLRAIQRPQAKKLPIKNIGALPPPPQRESSTGSNLSNTIGDLDPVGGGSVINNLSVSMLVNKKDPPPLPPPRPHRHGRSSSLDLNKFKIGTPSGPQPEVRFFDTYLY